MGGRGSGGRPRTSGVGEESQPLSLASELPADEHPEPPEPVDPEPRDEPVAEESPAASTAPAPDAPVEEWAGHISVLYDQVADRTQGRTGWVMLATLRALLGDAPREVQDQALRLLSRGGEFAVIPDANRKALTQADHDAAIRIGGQDQHAITRVNRRR